MGGALYAGPVFANQDQFTKQQELILACTVDFRCQFWEVYASFLYRKKNQPLQQMENLNATEIHCTVSPL